MVWIGNCDVTSIEIWCRCKYTIRIRRSKSALFNWCAPCTLQVRHYQNMRGVHHYERDTIHWLVGAPAKCARIQKHSRKGNFHAYSNASNRFMPKWFFLFVWNQITKEKFNHTHRSIDEGAIEKEIIPWFELLVTNMQHQKSQISYPRFCCVFYVILQCNNLFAGWFSYRFSPRFTSYRVHEFVKTSLRVYHNKKVEELWSKLRYVRQITPLCKRIGESPEIQIGCYRVDPPHQSHSGSSQGFFWLTEWNRSTLASLKFLYAFILAGIIVSLWRNAM